jgi:hypothetical protein
MARPIAAHASGAARTSGLVGYEQQTPRCFSGNQTIGEGGSIIIYSSFQERRYMGLNMPNSITQIRCG